MEIHINGEAVDFTLEHEQTLGEVMQGIESWMKDSRLVLTSAALGERDLLGQPAQGWRDLPVPQVGTLSLIMRLEQEVRMANLRTVVEFLDLLDDALRNRDASLLGQLRRDFPLLAESLQRQLSGQERKAVQGDWLGRRITEATVEQMLAWSDGERAEAATAIHDLQEIAGALLLEMEDPLQALRQVVGTMEHTIAELGEVSLLLQTGKDRRAMESIVRFSDLFESLIRIFSWLEETRRLSSEAEPRRGEVPAGDDRASASPQGASTLRPGMAEVSTTARDGVKPAGLKASTLKNLTGEINGYLRELIQAFQNGDSVLIGDLLEYEVAPRLATLKRFAESML